MKKIRVILSPQWLNFVKINENTNRTLSIQNIYRIDMRRVKRSPAYITKAQEEYLSLSMPL